MTLSFTTHDGFLDHMRVQQHLNQFAVKFRTETGREAKDIDLLRELRRMGYPAYLRDDEDCG